MSRLGRAGSAGIRIRAGGDIAAGAIGVGSLLVVLASAQGGFFPETWRWTALCLAALGGAGLMRWGGPRLGRRELFFPAGLAAFALWIALSAFWSQDPDASLREAERAALYALGAATLLVVVRSCGLRAVVLATASAVSSIVGYALFHGLLQGRPGGPFSPLGGSLGYANALGILAAIGILLTLGIAVHESGTIRRLGFATLVVLPAALLLTASRGAWLALCCGLALETALERRRTRLLATVAGLAPLAALAAWIAGVSAEGHHAEPVRAAVVAGIALVAALSGSRLVDLLARCRWIKISRFALVGCVGCAVLLVVTSASNPFGEQRLQYWHVALHAYRDNPVLGSGAGTFGDHWRAERTIPVGARDAHSLYVETLAELGPIALVALLIVLALPLADCSRVRAGSSAAALAAYAAFLIHTGLDWDWELPAVTLTGLICGIAVLGGTPSRRTG